MAVAISLEAIASRLAIPLEGVLDWRRNLAVLSFSQEGPDGDQGKRAQTSTTSAEMVHTALLDVNGPAGTHIQKTNW